LLKANFFNFFNKHSSDLYSDLFEKGLKNTSIIIESDNPFFLNIPWELIHETKLVNELKFQK